MHGKRDAARDTKTRYNVNKNTRKKVQGYEKTAEGGEDALGDGGRDKGMLKMHHQAQTRRRRKDKVTEIDAKIRAYSTRNMACKKVRPPKILHFTS